MKIIFVILCFFQFMLFTRAIFSDEEYEAPLKNNTYFYPERYDVMLHDLDHEKVADIARVNLEFEHNSDASLWHYSSKFPITGTIASGPGIGKIVLKVHLRYQQKKIQSLFMLDTMAPAVYLSNTTWNALGIDNERDYARRVFVQRQMTDVFRSRGHFSEVNILGASYLHQNRLEVIINYDRFEIVLRPAPVIRDDENYSTISGSMD